MFSDPVIGENFFGRQAILDLLIKRASALKSGYRQNVAMIGHQQLGKTSILRQFLHVYQDPQILPIYVEIKLQELDYFVDQFARSLLFQYLLQKGNGDLAESSESLAMAAEPFIPKTVALIGEIRGLLKQRRPEEAYSKLFELTASVRQETGKNCIVILDEFHRLGEMGIRNAFSDFGKRIMVQKDTMYLLSSSSFSVSQKILAEKLALLFGNFERVYLENFDFETSFSFLDKKLQPLGISYDLKHFLVAFTDGHPFFLETITSRLKELSLARPEAAVSRQTVADVLLKLLFESQGVLYQYFLQLLSPWIGSHSHGKAVLILTELARGNNKLKAIAPATRLSQKETSRFIHELIGRELILKTGVFYRFHNKIFKFWLREVYEKKELSVLGINGKREDFLAKIEAMLVEHEQSAGMDLSDRVIGLFGLFRNEMIEFGEKKRRLPHFTELIPVANPEKLPHRASKDIVAKGNGRCWVCKITEEKATEREVLELVQRAFQKKTASLTKVLVALNGLEDNAKLLAKEKKVLTLGLSRINTLMDVYGKCPIIPSPKASSAVAPIVP